MGRKTLISFFIYNFFLFLFFPLFYAVVNLLPKAKKIKKKRDLLYSSCFKKRVPENANPRIWLHGPSVGELDQSRAFARVVKKHHPSAFIFQTVFSDSVTEKQLDAEEISLYSFLPFDFLGNYDALLDHIQPSILVIFSWDTWPNLCYIARKRGIKLILASATLSPNSGREKAILRNLTKFTLSCFDSIFPSHQMFVSRFRNLVGDKTKIEVLGDTRFDSVLERIENQKPPEAFLRFLDFYPKSSLDEKPILFGSTYSSCESLLSNFIKALELEQIPPIWVFPHHWDSRRMENLASELPVPVSLFSEIVLGKKNPEKIVFFDQLGILAYAYQFARLAYVGGALHNRVHNTIEPAAHGVFLVTGDRIQNASEALVMRELGGLYAGFASELLSFLIKNHSLFSLLEKGKINRNFVLENRGASLKLYNKLLTQ